MRPVARDVLKFLAGFVLILILSAFLAPWLYSFLPFKFDRILRRCIMIGTLLLVVGLIRARRESWPKLGLSWKEDSLGGLSCGFLGGVAIVLAMTLIQWAGGARFFELYETDLGRWVGLFLKALGAGALIGLLEEFFFRGFLFVTLKDLWETRWSLIVANGVYAAVHFFPKGKVPIGETATVMDSFRIYSVFLPSGAEALKILPGFVGLFLFGLILSFVFLRTRSLYPSIAIHAGAVFGLKMNRRFLPEISERLNFWTGSKNLYDGIFGLAFLALVALGCGICTVCWQRAEKGAGK